MKKILLLLLLFVCTGVAAQTRDAKWYISKGLEYFKSENYDSAINSFKKANELAGGNKALCFFIGNCYNKKRDYTQAVYWYRRAAEQGFIDAQYKLGMCYANGEGVAEDQAQAVYWYRKAAEQGHALAQFFLATGYASGKGVAKNQTQAIYWLRKAAEQNLVEAQYFLGMCYLSGEGIAEDPTQAVFWFRKAAGQEDGDSMIQLGIAYYYGSGVPEDKSWAKYWIKKGLENNPSNKNSANLAKALISKE